MTVRGADGNQRISLKADELIPRFRWTRLTGVVDASGESCTLRLYVDGRKVAETRDAAGRLALADDAPLRVAQGVKRMPYLPVGRGQYPSQYSFDGLVDEVGIFNTALTEAQIEQSTAAYDMTEQRRTNPDMIRRVLPAGEKNWKDFGARYTHLPFHESWNKMFRVCGHPDIVVSFDKMPCRFVLWHGAGYIPMLVSENGRWYSNEFNENWWKGCCEPMSDKKMVFGRVHILEQSPARVVLKWRYPLSTVGYEISYEDPETGWGNWSTWYMTIYPDGSIVKRMRIYMSESRRHEWQESMAIMGPEQRPEAVIDTTPALTVATRDGTIRRYSWIGEPPEAGRLYRHDSPYREHEGPVRSLLHSADSRRRHLQGPRRHRLFGLPGLEPLAGGPTHVGRTPRNVSRPHGTQQPDAYLLGRLDALWRAGLLPGEAAVGGHVGQTGRGTSAAGQVLAGAGRRRVAHRRASRRIRSCRTSLRAHARQWSK